MVKEVAFFADIESLDKYYLNSIRNVQEMKYSSQGGGVMIDITTYWEKYF